MHKLLITLFSTILLFMSGMVSAAQTGTFLSIEEIEISGEFTLPAGSTVEFLGVIDVLTTVSNSGRLATFQYDGSIYNADASLFEELIEDEVFYLLPPLSKDNGSSTSICTTIALASSGSSVDFSNIDLSRYIEVKSGNKIINNYSILKPKNYNSPYRTNSDFCVQGLAYSTSYKITVLPGLRAYNNFEIKALETPISVITKTADLRPSIQLDPSKNILPTKSDAVIPVSITNVKEFDFSVYRVDLNSLNSYEDIFRNLRPRDIKKLKSFWGESIATKTIELDEKFNQPETINLSLNSMLKNVEPGLFVAIFESEELNLDYWDYRPTQWFMVSNIATQIFNGHDYTDIFINQFDTLRSIGDANVKVIAANNKTLFEDTFGSDDHIKISNKFLTGSGGFAPEIILISSLSQGTTILEISDLSQKPEILEGGVSKLNNHDVYLTTDRNIYRQSDTIHAFGVARQLDLSSIIDEKYALILKNQSGDEVSRSNVETNSEGIFVADISLKSIYPLGRYTLSVEQMDGSTLAMQNLSIQDFVPLTIEPKLSSKQSVWKLGSKEEISLSAEYFSGGFASGLDAELSLKVKASRTHASERLAGYVFGEAEFENDYEPERYEETLSENGLWLKVFENDFSIQSKNLFEILVQGTVFDVGGRPNKTRLTVPLDTEPTYIGVRPLFDRRLDEGAIAQFDVVNVNRSGEIQPLLDISYEVRRIYYDYNWYYNNGWRWRRVRVDDEVVETGEVNGSRLNLKTNLKWGRYEINLTNNNEFKTNHEFYVGWGADAKPASEPEELVAYYDKKSETLKFDSPFAGQLKVIVADKNLQTMEAFNIYKGPIEMDFSLDDIAEPGAHLLLTLSRAIDENTEHLPQLAVGKIWVENLSSDRVINVKFNAPTKLISTDEVKAKFKVSQETGSAIIFLVDEGIHAVTGYKNKDLKNHYFSERELQLGFVNNFGQIIQQDKSLDQLQMGGDELADALSQITKSDFFDTVATVSPILKIVDGNIAHNFKPADMEGRLRAVALVSSDKGLGMATSEIIIQDPVSIDISLPRFVAPGDNIAGKIRLRSNTFNGEIELVRKIGDFNLSTNILLNEGMSQDLFLPLQVKEVGKIPIVIEAKYSGKKITRSFELVSRLSAYPSVQLQAVDLDKNNWVGNSITDVPSLYSDEIDLNAPETEVEVSIAPSIGINLKQAVSALNRYPYGCIEQTSSGLRGLLAYAELNGTNKDLLTKINVGINGILRKQKNNGSFGYWSKYSTTYEKYQPYAIESLQMALPFADNRDEVVESITMGLEALYKMSFSEPSVRLYSYGILANSGYEVTSRIRYETDRLFGDLGRDLAEVELLLLHPDFAKLRQDNAFHDWAKEQPKWVQDALYENEDDAKSAARAIDLYKKEKGITTAKKVELTQARIFSKKVNLDNLAVAYWAVSKINDKDRMSLINSSFKMLSYLTESENVRNVTGPKAWFNPSSRSQKSGNSISLVAQRFGYLLSDLPKDYVTAEILQIREKTKNSFAQKRYRSTIDNAKLTSLFAAEKSMLDNIAFSIDGENFDLSKDRILPLSKEQLINGFKIKHSSDLQLSLNAELVGPRKNRFPVDNGYRIQKWWFDAEGKYVDEQLITAQQGQLFTVVIKITKTADNRNRDLLLTDLLPAGFEIEEDAFVSTPLLSSVAVYDDEGDIEPGYKASMDDRYIAHFDKRWRVNSNALLKYVVRSAYTGEVQVGGAHVEHMYAPEINGRSGSFRALVIEK